MKREVKLVSAWEGHAHENFSKLLKEEVEKQLGEADKHEIKSISDSLKNKIKDSTGLQKVLSEVFRKK